METYQVNDAQPMELFQVDADGLLFVSAEIVDWLPIAERKVRLVIDLDAEMDCGVPTIPNNLIYAYFPFNDNELPGLVELHALGRLVAQMMRHKRPVLVHCAMGFLVRPVGRQMTCAVVRQRRVV